MSPLDACAIQENVDIMTAFKYLFHEQTDIASEGEIGCVDYGFAAERFDVCFCCLVGGISLFFLVSGFSLL